MSPTSPLRTQIKSKAASTNMLYTNATKWHVCQIKQLFEKNIFFGHDKLHMFLSKLLPVLVNLKRKVSSFGPGGKVGY